MNAKEKISSEVEIVKALDHFPIISNEAKRAFFDQNVNTTKQTRHKMILCFSFFVVDLQWGSIVMLNWKNWHDVPTLRCRPKKDVSNKKEHELKWRTPVGLRILTGNVVFIRSTTRIQYYSA